jgi:hypothetical protein
MKSLILISSLVLVSGFPGGDHHGDGHEDNCVDVSRYSEVQYNITTAPICTYRTTQTCTKKVSSACVSVPVTECEVTGYADCTTTGFTGLYQDAKTTSKSFIPKVCSQTGVQTLIEYHKKPVCKEVTKEQCDTKWVVNEQGKKVWAGNENCQPITWEDCTLELVPTPISVPVWNCADAAPIFYSIPEFTEVEVTGYKSECTASAYPTCTTSSVQKCTEVEYDECFDTIEPVCFGCGDGANGANGCTFKVPFQTYDHRLKCIGEF